MKQRGRKAAAGLAVVEPKQSRCAPPSTLEPAAAALWRDTMRTVPDNHFTAADFVLLEQFCRTATVLLPQVDTVIEREGPEAKHLSTRAMLVKELASLATKLRLCVSARTRGDLASIRDAGTGTRRVDFGAMGGNNNAG